MAASMPACYLASCHAKVHLEHFNEALTNDENVVYAVCTTCLRFAGKNVGENDKRSGVFYFHRLLL